MLEYGFNLFAFDAGKPPEKLLYRSAAFEILKERAKRHARPAK
jgi:hypothetical protein